MQHILDPDSDTKKDILSTNVSGLACINNPKKLTLELKVRTFIPDK